MINKFVTYISFNNLDVVTKGSNEFLGGDIAVTVINLSLEVQL